MQKKKNVLVVAPLLWIEADTPCHSKLCDLCGPTTIYPCRKCYMSLRRGKVLVPLEHYTMNHPRKTRNHYEIAATTVERSSVINDAPSVNSSLRASDLSFTYRKTDDLLQLQSFDPSLDTPVEILHNDLLGIGKYLVTDLIKVVLKGQAEKLKHLSKSLKIYQKTSGLSCQYSRELSHCGSAVGRDFKILIQILPIILQKDFPNDAVLGGITTLFVKLGKISSLIFVREVATQLELYLSVIDAEITSLIQALYCYDDSLKNTGHNSYYSKPKVHLLTHFTQDMRRFGTDLNFETEKGEQFNKHIREHLLFTNRQNTSRDIGLKFAKQAIMGHVLDGGSWKNKEGHREGVGRKILQFIEENEEGFCLNFKGGSRNFKTTMRQ